MELTTRNVNTAFAALAEGFHTGRLPNGRPLPLLNGPSRNGAVTYLEEPFTLTYTHPRERVLLNPARDANPFIHLYEALWMLAGRNDVAPLVYYTRRFAEFSDDGRTLNGSYGYRWRHARTSAHDPSWPNQDNGRYDQLDLLVNHLKADPHSRRAVLQMWTVEDDLLKIGGGSCQQFGYGPGEQHERLCARCHGTNRDPGSRDVCCNTCVYFAVGFGPCRHCDGTGRHGGKVGREGLFTVATPPETCGACGGKPHDRPRWLNMTVCNRSNDLLWGLLGANACHFSVLQEYLAARLGLEVGVYHHFSNNVHVYHDRGDWWPAEFLAAARTEHAEPLSDYTLVPLVADPAAFERELPRFVERHSSGFHRRMLNDWTEPFLRDVAHPLLQAFHFRKDEPTAAVTWVERIADDGWRTAAREWLARRAKKATGV